MSSNEDQQIQDLSGKQLGHYRLFHPIGKGGFARVYLGFDVRKTTRKVAVAVETLSISQEYREHLRREADILLEFNHPHIARVFEYGIEGNFFYLVMEYYEKGNLYGLYPNGKAVSVQTIVRHIKQIASALQYAHARGVIHRDVKPENILVDKDDNVLLGDFGLAKQSISISTDGSGMGTPAYMAPEQGEGEAYSASDQYALAVVVYELLCGELPFQGSTAVLAGQHKVKILPSHRLRKLGIPRKVVMVLRRALKKRPENRYESVMEFAEELEKAASSRTRRVTQKFRDDRRAVLTGGTAVVMASVAAWFGWIIVSPASHPTPVVTRTPGTSKNTSANTGMPVPKQHKTILVYNDHHAKVSAVAWSPDGTRIASGGFDGEIRVWNLRGELLARYNHNDKVLSIAWDPTSTYIVSVSADRILHFWNATTGATHYEYPHNDNPLVTVATWSAVKDLAVGIETIARVYDRPINHGFNLSDDPFSQHKDVVNALSFSPDSKKVASASNDKTVCLWDEDKGSLLSTYTGHGAQVLSVDWAPHLNLIASGGVDRSVQIWDAIQLSLYHSYSHKGSVRAVRWSYNGQYLVSGGEDAIARLWKIDESTSDYSGHSDSVNDVAWSTDGTRVASASDDQTVHIWEV